MTDLGPKQSPLSKMRDMLVHGAGMLTYIIGAGFVISIPFWIFLVYYVSGFQDAVIVGLFVLVADNYYSRQKESQ